MKKVLLTTTALVMTAGVAAAEVSMSGTTQVALSNGTATTHPNGNILSTHIDFNVAVSSAADNGLTMSAGFGYDAGRQVDAGDFELDAEEAAASDITDDGNAANDSNNNPAWSTAAPSLTLGYNGITVTADGSGVADLYNGDVNSGDIGISGSMGGITFGLTTALSAGDPDGSMSLGYSMGDVAVSYVSTNNADGVTGRDGSMMSISYTMGDVKLTASSDNDGNVETIQKVGLEYSMDAVTVSFSAASNGTANSTVGDDWDASVKYSAGGLTASVATDEDSIAKISASYDLGGGASAFFVNRSGGTNDFNAVGVNFAF